MPYKLPITYLCCGVTLLIWASKLLRGEGGYNQLVQGDVHVAAVALPAKELLHHHWHLGPLQVAFV